MPSKSARVKRVAENVDEYRCISAENMDEYIVTDAEKMDE